MALHTELPIYKVAYDLLCVATDYVVNMPRAVKHCVGTRLTDLCVELVMLILRANCARDKGPHLTALLERNEEAGMLFRLCRDKKFISRDQYASAVELIQQLQAARQYMEQNCNKGKTGFGYEFK